ncbi:MAG: hypothetical protein WC756_22265 [Taibaiella sp.]|jgi:hypothetical protein
MGHEPFMSVNIFLTHQQLRKYSVAYSIKATGAYSCEPNILLALDYFMRCYIDSLLPYFDMPERLTATLAPVKTVEAVELLARNPSIKRPDKTLLRLPGNKYEQKISGHLELIPSVIKNFG